MTTSTLEVGDLFSILGAQGIEKQLQRIAGVGRVAVNPVSGSTTVTYDPGKIGLPAIKECGFHCTGEALPKHVCADHVMPGKSLPAAPIGPVRPKHAPAHKAGSAIVAPAA